MDKSEEEKKRKINKNWIMLARMNYLVAWFQRYPSQQFHHCLLDAKLPEKWI